MHSITCRQAIFLLASLTSLVHGTWHDELMKTSLGNLTLATTTLTPSDEAGKIYLRGLEAIYTKNTYKQLLNNPSSYCNIHNIRIRRCWDDMDTSARKDYIRAAKCMAQQPTRTGLKEVPGARSRIDDFTWHHIAQGNYVHSSGLLLPWHRQFIWAWEEDLRNVCNYTGALPYWDWSRHAYDQANSPVFQPDSFGGNGDYIPHNATIEKLIDIPGPVLIPRPAGIGGGCVRDGPFANSTGYGLSIGLVAPSNNTVYGSKNTISPNNTLGQQYQPRCLKRDFLQSASSSGANYTNVALLMRQKDIHTFHPLLENGGVHFNGHFFVGGDAADFYASPNEPTFWLHHAQVDRLWTVWQAQDFANRGNALDGTTTFANIIPSMNATLDTIMDMGLPAGGQLPIRKAMSVIGNAMCYMYV